MNENSEVEASYFQESIKSDTAGEFVKERDSYVTPCHVREFLL